MQAVVTALIVLACAFYAAWTLMPASLRRPLAAKVVKLPLPPALRARMQRAAVVDGGCACDGCDNNAAAKTAKAAKPEPGVHVVKFVRPPKRS